MAKQDLSSQQAEALIQKLKARFEKSPNRHTEISWEKVVKKLEKSEAKSKIWSLHQMEETGGEPDVLRYDEHSDKITFSDCATESPKGRRSLCYDQEALESRKKFKPKNSAISMAQEMGVELLNQEDYQRLQELGPVDTKTSSWLQTPLEVRKLGGAIFGDYRFGRVFIYHNGAESYYGARGFRAKLII